MYIPTLTDNIQSSFCALRCLCVSLFVEFKLLPEPVGGLQAEIFTPG